MTSRTPPYPNGARFAFTIIDDTDVATRENAEPFYDLLYELGMRTTKTVWPVGCPEGSRNFDLSETLEDRDYLEFVRTLAARGFEITWHGATMESSTRERTARALNRFHEIFGSYPEIHVNHSFNRENLYWGMDRIDSPVIRWLLAQFTSNGPALFQGHLDGSEYWWGDLATRHIRYGRNLTFNDINTLAKNPSMPYHDPARPLVARWFSASDAESVTEFNELISEKNQERLEESGGACIVATHVGKGFAIDGVVNGETRRLLTELAARGGWFPTVGELLDSLARGNPTGSIPPGEWRRMQWTWAFDLLRRRVRRRLVQHRRPAP